MVFHGQVFFRLRYDFSFNHDTTVRSKFTIIGALFIRFQRYNPT